MTQDLKDKALDILNRCTVDDNKVRLPDEEIDTDVWGIVKDALKEAGGQYNRKTRLFIFQLLPEAALTKAKAWLQEQDVVTYDAPVLYDGPETYEPEEPETKVPDSVNFRKEKRSLRYDFPANETHEMAMQLAEETKKLEAVEAEKSSQAANFSAKIKQIKGRQSELSGLITTGYEYRDVDVEVYYNDPTPGKKRILRTDNNTSSIEKMEPYEYNLFTQPAGEETV